MLDVTSLSYEMEKINIVTSSYTVRLGFQLINDKRLAFKAHKQTLRGIIRGPYVNCEAAKT